jgi:hypothetical protein
MVVKDVNMKNKSSANLKLHSPKSLYFNNMFTILLGCKPLQIYITD